MYKFYRIWAGKNKKNMSEFGPKSVSNPSNKWISLDPSSSITTIEETLPFGPTSMKVTYVFGHTLT